MYSGITGMKAHQIRMDVIGNNIANVNTYGFKSSRVSFQDVYYQSMRNAAEGTSTVAERSLTGRLGTLSAARRSAHQSAMASTGNALDLAISGEGYFQVQIRTETFITQRPGCSPSTATGILWIPTAALCWNERFPRRKSARLEPHPILHSQRVAGQGERFDNHQRRELHHRRSERQRNGNIAINIQSGTLKGGEKAKAVVAAPVLPSR
jgi:flagellar basal-body rod protein FlgB